MTGPRGIDHLVLPVRDLDAAGARYAALGFQVGARNRHPWGTENRIVQMPGSFLELIALGPEPIPDAAPPAPPFAQGVRDYLARHGEGFAMLVLASDDAAADKRAFDAAGIGGFDLLDFERLNHRADGTTARVAFTLAFAADPAMPDAGFFTCQQHEPANFWNEAAQVHRNGVRGIAGVVMVAEKPDRHAGFLAAFTGQAIEAGEGGIVARTPHGEVAALTPRAFLAAHGHGVAGQPVGQPHLAAIRFVADLHAVEAALGHAGIPFVLAGSSILVAAEDACGTFLIFEGADR